MAEELRISNTSKVAMYEELMPQIKSLIAGEPNLIANLANIAGALKQTFNLWWVGFYLVDKQELVLGPFQGPIACTRIGYNKGVCGTAWANAKTILVPNVEEFPGHIACSAASKSEIVVPIIKDNTIFGVLDCDSEFLNHFDETDRIYLEQLCDLIAKIIS
ncbi:MAG: GAF domain-containing protein [Bacteroidetes bacterium]|nr:MAG: GAF domain-containing protein [Bacteroidota bacterium]